MSARLKQEVLPTAATQEVEFGPVGQWSWIDLFEVWQHRELLFFLIWRDVKVRYKQTILGAGWAVLRPLMTMVAFSIIFGTLLHVPTGGVEYPVFTYTALLPWTFFASALSQAGASLVANSNLISKVYFPRLIIPFASVLGSTVDFAVAFLVLVGMMVVYKVTPGIAVLALPLFLLLALFIALGAGLWLAALQVKYRDVGYTIPFLTQLWLFATPVAYPISLVPEQWRLLYSLNPMVAVIEGFRWSLLGTSPPSADQLFLGTGVTLIIFISSLFFFQQTEQAFADVV